MRIAFEKIKSSNEFLNESELRDEARKNLNTYKKEVIRAEKFLALLLIHQKEVPDGLFGKRAITRIKNNNYSLRQFSAKSILKVASRYPNKIYRGSCRGLSMFTGPRNEIEMIEWVLQGKKVFSSDWLIASEKLYSQFKNMFRQWDDICNQKNNQLKPVSNLLKKVNQTSFTGMSLLPHEAHFLLEKIKVKTRYIGKLPKSSINKIIKGESLNMSEVAEALATKTSKDAENFEAAHHVNVVTSPFREIYLAIVEDHSTMQIKKITSENLRNIKTSYNSLNSRCSYKSWSNYKNLIERWITLMERPSPNALVEDLKSRAEIIVSNRHKKAPHLLTEKVKKRQEDSHIKEDIGFRESSYRLWNGSVILRDIYQAIQE